MSYEADKLRRDMAKDPMVRRSEPWIAAESPDGGSPLPLVADGITLRDWFAGHALGYVAEFHGQDLYRASGPSDIAAKSYEIADAMLAARSKVRS